MDYAVICRRISQGWSEKFDPWLTWQRWKSHCWPFPGQDRHHGGPYLIGLAPHRAYTQADVNTINSQPTTPQCLGHPHGGPHLTGAALRRAHTHYGGDRPRRYWGCCWEQCYCYECRISAAKFTFTICRTCLLALGHSHSCYLHHNKVVHN